MVWIKKARAGSDSLGHVWPADGAVIEVDDEDAAVLLPIPDGGFSEASEPAGEDDEPGQDPAEPVQVSEAPAPKRRGRPPKNPVTVEE